MTGHVSGEEIDGELIKQLENDGMEVNQADIKSFQSKVEPIIKLLKDAIDPNLVDKVIKVAQ